VFESVPHRLGRKPVMRAEPVKIAIALKNDTGIFTP
jgi:hypothetical protein